VNPPDRTANGQAAAAQRSLVTIIAAVYNEAGNAARLVDFFREIRASRPEFDFELVVVDDGSADDTARIVTEALADDDVVRVAQLSRNFGSHAALTAGLALSRGDCAISIGGDMQEPVAAISEYLDAWQAGHDLVWAVRKTRAVPKVMGDWFSRMFSRVFNRLSNIPTYPKDGPAQVLLSRQVIDVINDMPERNRNVFGMFAWVGFKQTTVYFDQQPRKSGKSKWTFGKKLRLVIDSFVEFSTAAFLFMVTLGLILAGLGLAGGLAVLVVALATLSAPVGWLLVLSAVFLLGGFQLAAIGVVGEYLWRAGDDARRRPVYILRGVHDHGAPAGSVTTKTATATATATDTRAEKTGESLGSGVHG
jgi:glycosyltransferase involved in cell wall biosynthesis